MTIAGRTRPQPASRPRSRCCDATTRRSRRSPRMRWSPARSSTGASSSSPSSRSCSRPRCCRRIAGIRWATVYLLGTGLFSLLAREFAPWDHRGRAALGRIEGIPAVLDAARENLTGTTDGRPVSLLHTETALSQLDGVARADRRGAPGVPAPRRSTAGEQLRDALERAAPAAREALDAFRRFLADEVKPPRRRRGPARPRPVPAEAPPHPGSGRRVRRPAGACAGATSSWSAPRCSASPASSGRGCSPRSRSPKARTRRAGTPTASRPARARRDREGAPPAGRAARLVPRRSRPHRDVLPRARHHRPARRAAEDHLDAGLHACLRRAFLDSPGPLDKGQPSLLLDHAARRGLGSRSAPSRTCARTTTGCSGCSCIHEGVPGHYLQLAWSNRRRTCRARSSAAACSPRAGRST